MIYKLTLLFTIIFLPLSIFAANSNNKFGIHMAQPNSDEFSKVKELVNSNGGDWGYVTLIIQENDRNKEKWQNIFDQLRENHLIPIIRLATQPEGENWRRPEKKDAQDWVKFLDSLNWVVKNRYVILFNEPNHGSEWGGEVDEKSYAEVSLEFAKELKEKNPDFFVMLAGFDASAPSWTPGLEDEEIFLERFLDESQKFLSRVNSSSEVSSSSDTNSRKNFPASSPQNIFDYIDGWSSHSYPNPGFSGSPYASGRGTVRTYEWELELLKELGVKKDLPVFITETGWKRGSEQIVADDFQTVYDQIWLPDDRVVAVTPFVLDYQGPPFLEFSWRKYGSTDYYQQYATVQSMSKIKGEPEQREGGGISYRLPTDLVVQSTYHFRIKLNNSGQAVWDKDFGYQLNQSSQLKSIQFLFDDLKDVNPFEEKDVYFNLKTNDGLGKKTVKFSLDKNDKNILESENWNFNILPLPGLKFSTSFFPWGKGKGNDYQIQIFDTEDNLVFKKKNLAVNQGIGDLKDIQNIALGELYRVVLLKPYYLPRQTFVVFKKDSNEIKFKSLLPFDFNNDGAFNFKDLLKLIGHR
jgi:hypothetical protein